MKKFFTSIIAGLMLTVPVFSFATELETAEQKDAETTMTSDAVTEVTTDVTEAADSSDAVEEKEQTADRLLEATVNEEADEQEKWEVTGISVNGEENGTLTAFKKNTIDVVSNYEKSGVEYKILYSYNNWADWAVLSSVSENTSVELTPKKTGTYEIFVDIFDGDEIIKKSFKVESKLAWNYSGVETQADMTVGKSYTVTPVVAGETDTLLYKFVCSYNNGAEWKVLSGFSSEDAVTFTPSKTGTYDFYVDVLDPNGNLITKSAKAKAALGWNYTGVSGVDSNTVRGTKVTIAPKIEGDTDGLLYKFVYSVDDWKKWGVFKAVSSEAEASITLNEIGTYDFYVDVIDSFGNVATKSAQTKSGKGWSLEGLKGVDATAIQGEAITITPDITGNPSNLLYKYVYSYNNWKSWGVIEPFGTKTSVSFTPDKVGTYDFYVDVLDSYGDVVTKSATTTTARGWSLDSIGGVSATGAVGEAVTIKPNIKGSSKGLQYKYVYSCNDWKSWGVIKHFSSDDSATFTPKQVGVYDYYVDALDAYGNVFNKSARSTVSLGWKFDSLSHETNMEIGSGTAVTAKTSGNNEKLMYKFVWNCGDWSRWGVFKEMSEGATATFTPNMPGTYNIFVDVADAYGNADTKSSQITVTPDWTYSGITVSNNDADINETVTITPNVLGNIDELQYKVVVSYLNGKSWTVVQQFSPNAVTSYKVTQPGYYDVYIDILDKYGYVVTKNVRITSGGGAVDIINKDWWTVVSKELPANTVYTAVDVWTGKRFQVKSLFGTNHMDVEPLTANDTAILKQIYGGKWSWDRRPVIIINGAKAYAGSMNGMPHEEYNIKDNNFDGHICIHFLNSRTHGSNSLDKLHQNCVNIAAKVGTIPLQ